MDSRDIIGPTSFNKGPGDSAEKEKFFNEELIRRIKKYLVLGAVAGVFTGIANGGAEADLWYGVSWRVRPYLFLLPPSCQRLNSLWRGSQTCFWL